MVDRAVHVLPEADPPHRLAHRAGLLAHAAAPPLHVPPPQRDGYLRHVVAPPLHVPPPQRDGYLDNFLPGPVRYIFDQLGEWANSFLYLLYALLVCVVLLVASLTLRTLTGGCPACSDGGAPAPDYASTLLLSHIAFPVVGTLFSAVAWVGFNSLLNYGIPGSLEAYMMRNRDNYLRQGQLPPSHNWATRLCEHAEATHQRLVAAGVPRERHFTVGCAIAAIFVAIMPMWVNMVAGFALASARAIFTVLLKLMHPHCVSVRAVRPGRTDGTWHYQVSLSHLAPDVRVGTPQQSRKIQRRFRDFRFLHAQLAATATRYKIEHVKTLPTADWLTDAHMNSPTSYAKDVGKGMLDALVGGVATLVGGGSGDEVAAGKERLSHTISGSEQERKALERAARLEVWLRAVLVDYRLNGQYAVENIFLEPRIEAGSCKAAHEQLAARSLDPSEDGNMFDQLGRQLEDLEAAVRRAEKTVLNEQRASSERAQFAQSCEELSGRLIILADTIDGGNRASRGVQRQAKEDLRLEPDSRRKVEERAKRDVPPPLPSVPAPREPPPEYRTIPSGTDQLDVQPKPTRVHAPATTSTAPASSPSQPAILLSQSKLEWLLSDSSSLPRTSSGHQCQHISLRNPSTDCSVFFKVKVNNRARYGVAPTCGVIAAGETLELKIVLLLLASSDVQVANPKARKDVFLVQAAWKPSVEQMLTADEFWEKNRQYHNSEAGKATLGKVQFSSHPQIPTADLDAVDE